MNGCLTFPCRLQDAAGPGSGAPANQQLRWALRPPKHTDVTRDHRAPSAPRVGISGELTAPPSARRPSRQPTTSGLTSADPVVGPRLANKREDARPSARRAPSTPAVGHRIRAG